jgi:hypothetical protein
VPPNRTTPSRGPWMLKWVGWIGTGRHSLNDFDVVIEDLGRPPDPDDPTQAEGRPIRRSFISEDIEPAPGLGVEIAGNVLEPDPVDTGKRWRLRRAPQ